MNERKLKARMVERGITSGMMAKLLGINPATLSKKMCGYTDFKRAEIQQMRLALSLNDAETSAIFLTTNLRKRKDERRRRNEPTKSGQGDRAALERRAAMGLSAAAARLLVRCLAA